MRGAPVSPSPILAAATENDRVATIWLARRRGRATAWRNIVMMMDEKIEKEMKRSGNWVLATDGWL